MNESHLCDLSKDNTKREEHFNVKRIENNFDPNTLSNNEKYDNSKTYLDVLTVVKTYKNNYATFIGLNHQPFTQEYEIIQNFHYASPSLSFSQKYKPVYESILNNIVFSKSPIEVQDFVKHNYE